MTNLFILWIFVLNFVFVNEIQAVGVASFNCEEYSHQNPAVPFVPPAGPPPPNLASIHYHPRLRIRHNVIPVLGTAAAHPIGLSLTNGVVWNDALLNLGGQLTIQQACRLAFRQRHTQLGINVRFANLTAIASVAAGIPPVPPPPPNYIVNSLRGGGYLEPLAATLYHLQNGAHPFPALLPGGLTPNSVIVHFRLPRRVSKNLKELSYNSILAPGAPLPPGVIPPYMSLKARINNQFLGLGWPVPDSITIVSSDFLQNP